MVDETFGKFRSMNMVYFIPGLTSTAFYKILYVNFFFLSQRIDVE